MTGPVILIAVFVVLGIVFSMGKGSFLIAGYNTMKKERRQQYDVQALCRFMGRMMFALAFCMALWLLGDLWGREWLITLGIILFVGVILFMLVYVNTGNRFKK